MQKLIQQVSCERVPAKGGVPHTNLARPDPPEADLPLTQTKRRNLSNSIPENNPAHVLMIQFLSFQVVMKNALDDIFAQA
jgi:hypothetical protein